LNQAIAGAIVVLLRAKHKEVIYELKPVLDDLLKFGFYISTDICHEVLLLAGGYTRRNIYKDGHKKV